MRSSARLGAAAIALVLLTPQLAQPQSVSQILDTYMERNASRLDGIDNVVLVQSVMGMSSEVYLEKVETDDGAVLQPRLIRTGGMTMPIDPGSAEGTFTGDASTYLFELADRAELGGTEAVDGEMTTIIEINDLSGFDFSPPGAGGQQAPVEARSMRLFVDTDDWVVRRMEMVADMNGASGPTETSISAEFTDFREVQGMVHPFRVVTSIVGMGGGASAEELEEARAALEQMEEQLAGMPEQQRQMVEQMMGEQMEGLMQMLESGTFTVEIEVQEVRVNEGPPSA